MDAVTAFLGDTLAFFMRPCYALLSNYGWAILLFVLITKVLQLPISIWVHKNGIKMIKMQPALNRLKVKYWGDKDTIADEESKLYKAEGYNPFASLIPLAVQLLLLMGVVYVIYNPLTCLLQLPADVLSVLSAQTGALTGQNMADSAAQLAIVKAVKDAQYSTAFLSLSEALPGVDLAGVLSSIQGLNLSYFGLDLCLVPATALGLTLLVPLLAALSAWLMSYTQNRSNVLQAEQGKLNQYGMLLLSVGLSLYLGLFVPAGIGLYWTFSNLLSIVQMYILNAVIKPSKYIDYEELAESRKELSALEHLGEQGGKRSRDPYAKRQRADYKRFFSIANKHLVFYSERGGFYKYYEALIDYLLKNSNVVIHYVTNDPQDPIFDMSERQPRIKAYYVGVKKLITLMMKMDADMVVMTTPDLDHYYIKRSLVRKDVEYVFVPHDSMSVHMGFREGALDAFDTVFCTGPHVQREVRATEQIYGLKEKTLVPFGYPLIEKLCAVHERSSLPQRTRRQILIAPSWSEDNLLDSCIDGLLSQLLCDDYRVIVRPHPEYMKRYGDKMQLLVDRYQAQVGPGLAFELDFTSNESIYASDLLITDWSGISNEYCFTTLRPALFINTKMKVENPHYDRIGITPQEISLRDQVGLSVDPDQIESVGTRVRELIENAPAYQEKIRDLRRQYFYNFGSAGEAGGDYILTRLSEASAQKKAAKAANA